MGKKTWAENGLLYKCELEKAGFPKWVPLPGFDKDHDGYTNKAGDCADDPKELEDAGYPKGDCPELDMETGEIACQYLRDSQCAICINPGAPEVCGDKINNDCGGSEDPEEMEGLDNLDGETSDDCNENQYSCEQKENLNSKKS